MRIVSMFALCFALSACTEEEVVTVLEPVALDVAVDDGGAVATEGGVSESATTVPSGGLTSGQ